jgi:hypothetical protein
MPVWRQQGGPGYYTNLRSVNQVHCFERLPCGAVTDIMVVITVSVCTLNM